MDGYHLGKRSFCHPERLRHPERSEGSSDEVAFAEGERSGEVDIDDAEYPALLIAVNDRPAKLYYRGRWDPSTFERCLAVVGSRKMTAYGKAVVESIVYDAAACGVTVVSGFMYGIDAWAHKVAVDAGGRTIAVMAGGVERVEPSNQDWLYRRIIESGGLVVSEFAGDIAPRRWSFPRRNRIVAGLSSAVLVVEAEMGSGSLITAAFARRYGRKVFAVPGNIMTSSSKGTHLLLKDGASIVTEALDILKFFGISSAQTSNKVLQALEGL